MIEAGSNQQETPRYQYVSVKRERRVTVTNIKNAHLFEPSCQEDMRIAIVSIIGVKRARAHTPLLRPPPLQTASSIIEADTLTI